MLSTSSVGISVTPLSSSTLSVPPVTSPVLASMSQVSSSPASAQIRPVSSLMMSRAAKRPTMASKGTSTSAMSPASCHSLTMRGVIFLPAGAITSPVAASIRSWFGLVPRSRSGKKRVAQPLPSLR